MRYHLYVDSTSGWLKVTRKILQQLNIDDLISSSSKEMGDTIFLNRDTDMSFFIEAWQDYVGCQFPLIAIHYSLKDPSSIRNYPFYKLKRREEYNARRNYAGF